MSFKSRIFQVTVTILVLLTFAASAFQPPAASAQAQDDGIERDYNTETGKVSMISGADDQPLTILSAMEAGMTDEQRTDALVQSFAPEFGVTDPVSDLQIAEQDETSSNRVTTKYQQTHDGVPVMGGELMVNSSEQGALYSMNGELAQGLDLDTIPSISAEDAAEIAKQGMAKWYQNSAEEFIVDGEPELWIFDESLLRPSIRPAELVWQMEVVAADQGQPVKEFVLVNAENGNIPLHFNQIDTGWQGSGANSGMNQPPQQEETPTVTPTATEVPPTETPAPTETVEPTATSQPTETAVPTTDPYETTPTPQFSPTPEDDLHAQAGNEYFVNEATGLDTNSCTQIEPCWSIQKAINLASPGDIIKVASGTYIRPVAINLQPNAVIINKSLTILGGWDSSFTTQSGVSTVDGANANNGILITTAGTFVIENFIVQNGYSGSGGGIYLVDGDVTLRNVTAKSNLSSNVGAGIYVAIDVDSLTIINSTISGNTAQNPSQGGGGIHSVAGMITIKNSTIAYNTAYQGGGIYRSAGMINIINSIIANNTGTVLGPDCYGTIASVNYSIVESTSACTITTGGNNLNVDPQINSTLTGTMQVHALLPGSPALNSGDPDQPNDCQLTDQVGTSRPQGSGCDMGAVEYVANLNIVSGNNQFAPLNSAAPQAFTVRAMDANDQPISGVLVTFTAPGSGPSGTFIDSGTNVTTATTDGSGYATAATFTGNGSYGISSIVVTASGYPTVTMGLTLSDGWFVSTTGSTAANFMCTVSTSPCFIVNSVLGNPAFIPGDTIKVASGTYGTFTIATGKNAVISGGWNSTFTAQNAATVFGHLEISGGSVIRIQDVNIVGSTFTNGGGVYNAGNLTLERVAIYDSAAQFKGGGIYQNSGQLSLINVTISGNDAFSSNTGANGGGGIYVQSGSVVINNSTITQNRTSDDNGAATGGGIANPNDQPVTITNTIIAGNIAEYGADCTGQITSGGHNLVGSSSGCTISPQTGDRIGPLDSTAVAMLGDLLLNSGVTKTHALTTGSYAIDSGDAATCEDTDQRGVARPQGAVCDIGAFEGSEAQSITGQIRTYSASNSSLTLTHFRCDETSPNCSAFSGDSHAVNAHRDAIGTYAFYLDEHDRLSIDNNNMAVLSTVHFQSGYDNAFWNGDQVIYGDARGWPLADDVVAHEFTHGVTQYESNLFYFYQSGAINESFSDLWGEYYDQTHNASGTQLDSSIYDWRIGEDLGGSGAIRSMSNPPQFNDPDMISSTYYVETPGDSGGVHSNSGVNNKAVYLMVAGDSFNGKTVTGIGWEKTAAIYYEVNTNLLTSASDYSDLYYALQQACASLALTNFKGITNADCVQVKNAIDAVEMNGQPAVGFNPDALACPAGNSTSPIFNLYHDDFEDGSTNWTPGAVWSLEDFYASSGTHMMYGNDSATSYTSALVTTNGILLPAGTSYLAFKHAYAFEYYETEYYDGGVLEYSINNGSTWADAKFLFSDGKSYNGTIFNNAYSNNSLKGRQGFVGDSHGYVSSRYNLTSLAGKTVQFRWNFATDQSYNYFGWVVDDVKIYTCITAPSIPILQAPAANALVTDPYTPFLNWSDATPNVHHYQVQVATNNAFTSPVIDEANVMVSQFNVASPLTPNTTYYWRVRSFNQLDETKGWSAPITFRTSMLPPDLLAPDNEAVLLTNRPTFDWSDVLDTTTYTLQVSTSDSFASFLINTPVNGSAYTPITNLPVGQTIYWRVLSNGANGPSAPSSVRRLITANPPSIPALSAPAENFLTTDYTPTLDWANSTLPAGITFDKYVLEVATDAAFTAGLQSIDIAGTVADSQYTFLTDLNPNTKYYWRVKSFNTLNQSFGPSAVRSFRTALLPPVNSAPAGTPLATDPVQLNNNRPVFDWNDVPGATGYTLQVSSNSSFTAIILGVNSTTSTFATTADLLANTTLYWRVLANGANGPSAPSAYFTLTTANAPSVPTLLTPAENSLVTTYTPTLDWANSTFPMSVLFGKYQVEIATDAAFTMNLEGHDVTDGVGFSFFTITSPLNPNTKYYWRVRSFSQPGHYSNWSPTRSFRTVIDKPTLQLPANTATPPLLTNRPTFDWDDIPGATNYNIQVSTVNTFASFVLNMAAPSSTYTPTFDLPAGKTLFWRVIALGANGPSAPAAYYTFTTANPPSVPMLSAPANNALVNLPTYMPTLDWANSTLPVGVTFDRYHLQVATDAAFSSIVEEEDISGDITDSDFTFSTPLNPNTKYYWRVRSYSDGTPNPNPFSGWSLTRSFRTVIATPNLVSPSGQLATNRPTFDWDDVPGATNYMIQVSTVNTFASFVVNTTAVASTFTPPGDLPAGKTLFWRVIANGANGPSLIPTAFSIITANPPSVPMPLTPAENALVNAPTYITTLDWANSTVPAGTFFAKYQLQVATDTAFTAIVVDQEIINNINDSVYTTTPLDPNTKYYWRVRSFNDLGHFSGWSTTRSFRVIMVAPQLQAPANLDPLLTNRPTFDWNDVPGATNYTIQISTVNTFASLLVNMVAPSSTFTPTVDLPAAKTLYWRVIANGPNGPSLIPAYFTFTTANPPSVPVLSTPADNALVTNYMPTLDWSNSTLPAGTNFDKYQIDVATDAAFTTNLGPYYVASNPALSVFTISTQLNPNTKYYWRVRSFNLSGHFSGWSTTRSFRTVMDRPELQLPLDATPLSTNRPTFDWDDVPGAANYTIQVSPTSTFAAFALNTTAAGSTYTPTADLPANITLYWRVIANGPNGPSLPATFRSFTTAKAPSIPALSAPADNVLTTDYTPTLDWANSTLPAGTNFVKYQVQIATDAAFTANLQLFEVTGISNSIHTIGADLLPNTKYYWHVRSHNDLGQFSSWSLTRSFRTALLPPTLATPADATQLLVNKPTTFDWDDVPGATNYTFQVSTVNTFTSFLINMVAGSSTYTHTLDLPAGKTLYWRVIANGANGPSLPSTGRTIITANPPSVPIPSAPAENALLTTFTPRLDWANATVPLGVTFDKYEVQIATDLGFSVNLQSFDVTGMANSEYTFVSALNPNTKYYWRVRTYNTSGHYSAWSTVRSFRTLLATPTGLTPSGSLPISNLKPVFDWADVAGATGYTIQISTSNTFSSFVVNKTTVTSAYTPTVNLPANTAIYWRVIANGPNGPSAIAPYQVISLE